MITSTKMRTAVCDMQAFLALRSLVEGPLNSFDTLTAAERLVRGVVLHDEMDLVFSLEPFPSGDKTELLFAAPALADTAYACVINDPGDDAPLREDISLSPELVELARRITQSAGEPECLFEEYVNLLRRTVQVYEDGGSVVCEGAIWRAVDRHHSSFPSELLSTLDGGWTEFARSADAGEIGPTVPPVLSIVLSRAATREDICRILADLRDEWAIPREKVWNIVDAMKHARDYRQLHDLRGELTRAGKHFLPSGASGESPLRFLWNVLSASGVGAATAVVAGGRPEIGAAIAAIKTGAEKAIPEVDVLLRRGAFDLAARVRRSTASAEPMPALLARLLTGAEKRTLGL